MLFLFYGTEVEIVSQNFKICIMKNLLFILAVVLQASFLNAQDYDQNPNYLKSQEKYMASSEQYTSLQGTTAQETYKAIDRLEEKRELKAKRRALRAQRPVWRQERRLERIKNRPYYYNYGYGLNFDFYTPFYRPYRRFNSFCY